MLHQSMCVVVGGVIVVLLGQVAALHAATIDFAAESGALSDFAIGSDPAAIGSQYITTLTGSSTATYNVDFTQTGNWYLYARVEVTEPNAPANDSFYVPDSFATFTSPTNTINNVPNGYPTSKWAWLAINSSATGTPQFGDTGPSSYNVTSTGTTNFSIGGREDGFLIDHFVFSTDNSLTPYQLEASLPGVAVANNDTYGRRGGTSEVHGTETVINVKKEGSTGAGGTTRKGAIEFDLSNTPHTVDRPYDSAKLLLDVDTFSGSSTNTSSDFYVWGVRDGVSVETFDQTTADYNTFKPPFDDSGDGTDNGLTYLYDGVPGGNAQPLGTFTVTTSDVGHTVIFSSQALIDFLNSDTNGIATILLTRVVNDVSLNSAFASSEATTLLGPRLLLTTAPTPAALPAGMALLAMIGVRRRRRSA